MERNPLRRILANQFHQSPSYQVGRVMHTTQQLDHLHVRVPSHVDENKQFSIDVRDWTVAKLRTNTCALIDAFLSAKKESLEKIFNGIAFWRSDTSVMTQKPHQRASTVVSANKTCRAREDATCGKCVLARALRTFVLASHTALECHLAGRFPKMPISHSFNHYESYSSPAVRIWKYN